MTQTLIDILLGFLVAWAASITYFLVQLFRLLHRISRDAGY